MPSTVMAATLPEIIDDDTELDEDIPPMEEMADMEAVGFPIPPGFEVPPEAQNGEPFEANITLRFDGEGLVIDKLVAGAKKAEAREEKAVEREMEDEEDADDALFSELRKARGL